MSDKYPKTLVVIRDCHASNNLTVTAHNEGDEEMYRKMAEKKQWKVAVRKPKAEKEPCCDNCTSMDMRNMRDGTVHRWCDFYGCFIPDEDIRPVCDHHGAFNLTLTPLKGKGGAL